MYDEPKFMTIDGEVVDTGIIYWNVDTANNCRDIFNTCCSKLLFASNELANITIPEDCLIDKGIITTIKTTIDETATSLISTKNALLIKVERLENADKTNGEYVKILDIYDQKSEDVINDIFNKYFYEGQNLEDIAMTHYDQLQYPGLPYGRKDIRSGGCGISCLAGMFTEILGDIITPADIAQDYKGDKRNGGTSDLQMEEIAAAYGFSTEKYFWEDAWKNGKVMEALANGQQVILCVQNCDFTKGGHYIRLTGLTEDGKIIVHDPNGANWTNHKLADGFENGFTPEFMSKQGGTAFIFDFNGSENQEGDTINE